VAQALAGNEARIAGELTAVQGKPVDIGGYYHPDRELASRAMRPSATLNAVIDALRG
jgi:isocitrate dehydrogenase